MSAGLALRSVPLIYYSQRLLYLSKAPAPSVYPRYNRLPYSSLVRVLRIRIYFEFSKPRKSKTKGPVSLYPPLNQAPPPRQPPTLTPSAFKFRISPKNRLGLGHRHCRYRKQRTTTQPNKTTNPITNPNKRTDTLLLKRQDYLLLLVLLAYAPL